MVKKTKEEIPTKESDITEVETSQTEAVDTEGATTTLSFVDKIKNLSPKKKWLFGGLAALVVLMGVAWVVPSTKYAILNTVSEADASIAVLDSETDLPVKGALVTLGSGQSATTDENGVAFFNDAEYGATTATITKDAYETVAVEVTISKDDIVLDSVKFVSIGVLRTITAQDWLSEAEVTEFIVESADGESSFPASEGIASVNIPLSEVDEAEYVVVADGYNSKPFTIKEVAEADQKTPIAIELVRSGEHSFLSDRDGDIGFYKSAFDGSSAELIVDTKQDGNYLNYLAVPGSDDKYAVLLSSKGNSTQDQLALVDLSASSLEIVDEAVSGELYFSFVAVDAERIVYQVRYTDERSLDNKLKTYEFGTKDLKTIQQGPVSVEVRYYADEDIIIFSENRQSRYYNDVRTTNYELSRQKLPDGEKEVLLKDRETSLVYTPGLDDGTFVFYADDGIKLQKRGYYSTSITGPFKFNFIGANYSDLETDDEKEIPDSEKGQASPEGTNRVWIDQRDGKGRLILNESANVINGAGSKLSVGSIIRWIDETTLTVTGSDGTETADFIIDIESGNYQKITNTFSQSYGGHGF